VKLSVKIVALCLFQKSILSCL